jgi:serine/threonine protein kinase
MSESFFFIKSFSIFLESNLSSSSFPQVIHGEINFKNILIRHADSQLKLIDFGSSFIQNEGDGDDLLPLRPERRNILYFPPADERVTCVWDSWSCGVVLYGMMMGKLPFKESQLTGSKKFKLYLPLEMPNGPGFSSFFFHSLFSLPLCRSPKRPCEIVSHSSPKSESDV